MRLAVLKYIFLLGLGLLPSSLFAQERVPCSVQLYFENDEFGPAVNTI